MGNGIGLNSMTIIDTKKCFTFGILTVFVYFFLGDVYLHWRLRSSDGILPITPSSSSIHENGTESSCYISPFCRIDVKSLLLDLPNFYIHNIIARSLHALTNFQVTFSFISPNMISVLSVFVSIPSAKCISHDSLLIRRIGVILFELRNFLDAMDGIVARGRRSIEPKPTVEDANNNKSPPPESPPTPPPLLSGYVVDGICDGIGCVLLFSACLLYLKRHPFRSRNYLYYSPIPLVVIGRTHHGGGHSSSSSHGDGEWETSTTTTVKSWVTSHCSGSPTLIVWFGFLSLACSASWNRYISSYGTLLEDHSNPSTAVNQARVVRSTMMALVIVIWRLINVHSMVEMLLLAIFFDKLGEFLAFTQYLGWLILVGAVSLTEIHLYDTYTLLC